MLWSSESVSDGVEVCSMRAGASSSYLIYKSVKSLLIFVSSTLAIDSRILGAIDLSDLLRVGLSISGVNA